MLGDMFGPGEDDIENPPEFYPIPPFVSPVSPNASVSEFDYFQLSATDPRLLKEMADGGSKTAKQELQIRKYGQELIRGLNSLLRDAAHDKLD
jgi:hypothetical protein